MERLFISRQSRHSNFDVVIMSVLFHNWTLTWRVNIFVSRQPKKYKWEKLMYKTEMLLFIVL